MIDVKHLVKWYGPTCAIDDLTFAIPQGQIVGFLGPNGAVKSTTLRILTGYLPPTSGQATIDGHDVLTESLAVRRKIGYMPESTPLYPEMRVEEYLHYRGKLFDMPRTLRCRRIDVLCDRCGLTKVRRRPIGHLSKGNKQRVGLATALIHHPPVLILDEPTAGLDPNQIGHVRTLIGELREKHTIILSTHILPEVEKTADRVIIIAGGRIVAQGTPDELRQNVASRGRVLVEVKADTAAVAGVLRQIDGVNDVATRCTDGWCHAAITPADGRDVREALAYALHKNHWVVRELRHEGASLEQFFVHITDEQPQPELTVAKPEELSAV
jgi:ABC-2 type transport system ATP-binding protein